MSTITIVNSTQHDEPIQAVLYARPANAPTNRAIAWKVVDPLPDNGETVVDMPGYFGVYASYSTEGRRTEGPYDGGRTPILPIAEGTGRFLIQGMPPGIGLSSTFTDLVPNEVRIENQSSSGVWAHIVRDGNDIYAPQILPPEAVHIADIRSTLYLAVAPRLADEGFRLNEEETALTETPILEGQTAVVTGSKQKGYTITIA